jgi:uncharacterized DUF497 family protein
VSKLYGATIPSDKLFATVDRYGGGKEVKLRQTIWKEAFLDKIVKRHGVDESEVDEILFSSPHIRRAGKGRVKGEHVYAAYGQTDAGRYLIIFFIYKGQGSALPISARDMTDSERRYYDDQI